ncbi:MAG: HNH endonuclease [Deltaproteobacteria bacterium]|nr:MAG: HNH endonuclease [Deltaproteobacteria bacterium]
MDTLILSAAYEPIERVSWQRAMTLLVAGRAELVEEYEDRHVRTVRYVYAMPSVLRFVSGLKWRRRSVRFSRQNVYLRDGGRCQYCRRPVPRHAATYDHVMPRSRGGRTTWKNIVIACLPCNQAKGARTPEEAGMRLAKEPVVPKRLPDARGVTITWDKGMPLTWRQYLIDRRYWNDALEQE